MDCIQCFVTPRRTSQVQVQINRQSRHRRQYSKLRPKPLKLRVSRDAGRERTTKSHNRPPTPYPHQHLSYSHSFVRDGMVTEARRPRRRIAHVLVTRGIRECDKRYYYSSNTRARQYMRPAQHQRKRVSFADEIHTPQSSLVDRRPEYDEVIRSFSNLKLDPDSREPRQFSHTSLDVAHDSSSVYLQDNGLGFVRGPPGK